MFQLYGYLDIVTAIKVARLRWVGHVCRMDNNEIPKRVMRHKPEGRSVGRPKLHWMDGMIEDLRKLGVSWWTVARNRESWRKNLKEAEARMGL